MSTENNGRINKLVEIGHDYLDEMAADPGRAAGIAKQTVRIVRLIEDEAFNQNQAKSPSL
jgi:hypothetical protein